MMSSRLDLTAHTEPLKVSLLLRSELVPHENSTGMNVSRNSDVSSDLRSSFLLLGSTAQRLLLVLVPAVKKQMDLVPFITLI